MGLVPTPGTISGAKSGFEEMMVPTPSAPTAQARMQQYRGGQIAMISKSR